MKNECKIVEDLLPLYVDDLCQPETSEFVSKHLSGCKSCNQKYSLMKKPAPEEKIDKTEIHSVKKPFKKVVLKTMLKTAACVIAGIFAVQFIMNAVALNNCRITGPVTRELYFYTADFYESDSGIRIARKNYTNKNGQMLEGIASKMLLTYANSFEYKDYLVEVESARGCSAAVWGDKYYELFRIKNDLDSVCNGEAYITIRKTDDGERVRFADLTWHDKRVIENAAKSMAYIDEVITRHVIENYRDDYTEYVYIDSTVAGLYKAGMYLDENSDGKTEVVKLSAVVAKDETDNRVYTFKDTITFDLTGWKQGKLPTYTVESVRLGGEETFSLSDEYQKYHKQVGDILIY